MSMKVVEQVALTEFERMCAANNVEQDESQMDEEEIAAWHELRRKIVKDICRGALAVDEQGRPVYTLFGNERSLTFDRATCATLMTLETHGKGKDISNMVAVITELTGSHKGSLAKMTVRDTHACGRLARLFLADQ